MRNEKRKVWVAVAASWLAAAALTPVSAAPLHPVLCSGDLPQPAARPDVGPRLRFGTTAAGRVFRAQPASVDSARTIAAVNDLAGPRPFVVRVNRVLFADGDVAIAAAAARARTYTAAGHLVELQLRYQTDGNAHVDEFAAWVRRVVQAVGPNRGVVSLQVTNEANLSAPDNSDGAYPGAVPALVNGIVAGHDEATELGHHQLQFGFSWYYQHAPAELTFWRELGTRVSPRFLAALDWVGLSAYPGTYHPRVPMPGTEGAFMVDALGMLRCSMRAAGLGDHIPIRVSENGWPTDPVRPDVVQAAALERMVRAVHDHRATYNVTDYSWFTLWDASDAIAAVQKESHYGLLRADLTPKAAYAVFKTLVGELGG